uniref:Prostate and testis expressed 1 n=1 Tax=Suricata suricatta TaxID=37032 RepID=A0A673UH05_SURSU
MNKPLLLGLPILLCYIRVLSGSLAESEHPYQEVFVDEDHYPGIVQCRMCHLKFPGEKCSRGRGICTITREESCTTGRIFKRDGTPWLTFMGCLKSCANVDKIKWSVYLVDFRCCRGYDFCNEFL